MYLVFPVIVMVISTIFTFQFCQFKATMMKMALKNLALMKMNITLMKNYHQKHNPYKQKMKMNMALKEALITEEIEDQREEIEDWTKEELITEEIEDWTEEIEDWTEEIEDQTEEIEAWTEERGIWEINSTTCGYCVI